MYWSKVNVHPSSNCAQIKFLSKKSWEKCQYCIQINKEMMNPANVPFHLMNRHLLHPALLHRLLQRMAWNLHLDTVGANWLDVVLVLPRHKWENLRAESLGNLRNEREWRWQQSKWEIQVSKLYQPLFFPRGLSAWDGGLADGFTDGLGLKLRTGCLSIPVFVPFSFQPVCLDFNISLKNINKH